MSRRPVAAKGGAKTAARLAVKTAARLAAKTATRLAAKSVAIATIITVGVTLALSGCSLLVPSASTEPRSEDTPITEGTITGWDGSEYTTFGSTVSQAVAATCPSPWDLVSGDEILALEEALSTAEFHICVFTFTPDSVDPDLVDEIAYRVDEGGFELAMAYATYPFGVDGPQCGEETGGVYALMTTVIDGVTYGVNPGPGWCPTTQPENQALLDALELTMVVRDTVGPNG